MDFVNAAGKPLPVSLCDYRVIGGGFRAVTRRELPVFLNAPRVIFLRATTSCLFLI